MVAAAGGGRGGRFPGTVATFAVAEGKVGTSASVGGATSGVRAVVMAPSKSGCDVLMYAASMAIRFSTFENEI